MKAISYTCFKLEEEITRSVNKSNFINIIGDTFVLSIRWEAFQLYKLSVVSSVTYVSNRISNWRLIDF